MSELEPRIFSFNNPAGACPTCDGLGVQQYFDPAKVIGDPAISLANGAIRGWDKRSFYYFQMLKSSPSTTSSIWRRRGGSATKIQEVILRGSGRTEIEFRYMNDRGDVVVRKHPFEGSCTTWSGATGKPSPTRCAKSSKYIANKSCTSCGGSRLREEAPRLRRQPQPAGHRRAVHR